MNKATLLGSQETKETKETKEDIMFGENSKETLERNEKLAKEGFDISDTSKTVDWNDFGIKPIGHKDIFETENEIFETGDTSDRYYRLLDVVKDLLDEIEYLKGNK